MTKSILTVLAGLFFTQTVFAAKLAPGNCPQAATAEKIVEAVRASGDLTDLCPRFYRQVQASESNKNGYSNPSPCSVPQLQIARHGDSWCSKWEAANEKKK